MKENRENDRRALDGIGRFIRDIGFPIFVALYFLFSLGPKIDRNTETLQQAIVIMGMKK